MGVGVNPLPPAYRHPDGPFVTQSPKKEALDQLVEDCQVKSSYIPLPQEIPGYTGHARRIAADNIYGCTFKNAKLAAVQSQARIDGERTENLGMVSGNPRFR